MNKITIAPSLIKTIVILPPTHSI